MMPTRHSGDLPLVPSAKRARVGSASSGSLPSPGSITADRIRDCLDRYPSLIPNTLTELDEKRFKSIPAAIATRSTASLQPEEKPNASAARTGSDRKGKRGVAARSVALTSKPSSNTDPSDANSSAPCLTKEELIDLVEWKLKHGTFRPALLGMAKQHSPDTVIETSSRAFALLPNNPLGALKIMTELRGIGPATASLILSCADEDVPFFQDELFRWVMWDEAGGGGWARTIKYTEKEYKVLLEKVKDVIKERNGEVSTIQLEKVAYVLARE